MIPENLPKGAVAQRGGTLYSVRPRTPLGEISAEQLNVINSVVQDFNLPGVRVTAAQRLSIRGIPGERSLRSLSGSGRSANCVIIMCRPVSVRPGAGLPCRTPWGWGSAGRIPQ